MSPIDLGKKWPRGCPEPATKIAEPEDVNYPSVYIEGVDGLSDLPEQGTITFRFKRTSKTDRVDRDGDKSTSVSLDLLEVVDATKEDAKKVDDREDQLDKLAKEETENPSER